MLISIHFLFGGVCHLMRIVIGVPPNLVRSNIAGTQPTISLEGSFLGSFTMVIAILKLELLVA